jgi:hypothetical protein
MLNLELFSEKMPFLKEMYVKKMNSCLAKTMVTKA